MKSLSKAIIQNENEGRGFLNGNLKRLANHTNEITYNVSHGKSCLGEYTFFGWVKFATEQDAMDYLNELGAKKGIPSDWYNKDGQINNKEYYTFMKQESCVFSEMQSYSIQ